MIPKIIHYCWFGGKQLPQLSCDCIKSWQKYLPDYEIIRWDESNFDVNSISFISEAYRQRKYAFVSDYARFSILYNYGGLYFDTDVEIIRNLNSILQGGPFMAMEPTGGIGPGLGMGADKGNQVLSHIMELYKHLSFDPDRTGFENLTVVRIVTDYFRKQGFKEADELQSLEGFRIYPSDYFCPVDNVSREQNFTCNTVAVHHYAGSWQPKGKKLRNRLKILAGPELTRLVQKLKAQLHFRSF